MLIYGFATYLTLDAAALKALYENEEEQINIAIPRLAKSAIQVSLSKKQILGDHFYVTSRTLENGRVTKDYVPGNYYQNIENGQFAAISIFEKESGMVPGL